MSVHETQQQLKINEEWAEIIISSSTPEAGLHKRDDKNDWKGKFTGHRPTKALVFIYKHASDFNKTTNDRQPDSSDITSLWTLMIIQAKLKQSFGKEV